MNIEYKYSPFERYSGVPPQRAPPRHLLPRVAMAGPPEPPRTEAVRCLPLSLQRQAEGRLHQSLPLQEG